MTESELADYVKKIRTYAQSAPSLGAKLASESDGIRERKPRSTKTAARKAALDAL